MLLLLRFRCGFIHLIIECCFPLLPDSRMLFEVSNMQISDNNKLLDGAIKVIQVTLLFHRARRYSEMIMVSNRAPLAECVKSCSGVWMPIRNAARPVS